MNSMYEEIQRQRCEHCRDCAACCREVPSAPHVVRLITALLVLLLSVSGLVVAGAAMANPGSVFPEDSIYRLDAQLADQDGRRFAFAEASGPVRLVTLFYAKCPYVCPMLVDQVRAIENELDASERKRLRVLLITLEAEVDTPDVLAEVARKRRIDATRWTLAQPRPADVRKLAAVLDVQYRKLPDGEFNHSSVITLLDPHGRILAQTRKLGGQTDAQFVAAVRAALAAQRGPAP